MHKSRRDIKAYTEYRKGLDPDRCRFCDIDRNDDQFISQTEHFKVVRNTFPFTMWDYHGVEEHLMIIPKQHTETLTTLSKAERLEYVDLLLDYEGRGYNVYARPAKSKVKTVPHQHTHLVKLDDHEKKFMLYLKKPWIRLMR